MAKCMLRLFYSRGKASPPPSDIHSIGSWMDPEPVWTLQRKEFLLSLPPPPKNWAIQPVDRPYTERAIYTPVMTNRA
jgi:hypothetical protein